MTVTFHVVLDEELHVIRADVPQDVTKEQLEEIKLFVTRTAYLEHSGYVPKCQLNSMA